MFLINLGNTHKDTLVTLTTYGDIVTLSTQLVDDGRNDDGGNPPYPFVQAFSLCSRAWPDFMSPFGITSSSPF